MTYQEVLSSCDYPTECVVIDFETYFDATYNLKKMSSMEFIQDKRFEILGVGIYDMILGIPGMYADPQIMIKFLQDLYGKNFEKCTIVVHNCFFDIAILHHKFGIYPSFMVDTIWLANHQDARASSKLKDLAGRYKLSQPKGDTKQFSGKHADTVDYKALSEYCRNDAKLESELVEKLLPILSNPHTELAIMRHTLEMFLQPRVRFNFEKARELSAAMLIEKNRIIQLTGHTDKELGSDIVFAQILQAALPAGEKIPRKPGKPTKNMIPITGVGMIPALAKDDEGVKVLLAHPNETVRNLIQARLDLSSWPGHIKRIGKMAGQARACGGLLPIPLHYYGGHTGRDSGAEGINPQNFGGRKGIHPLIGQMRSLLVAPVGCEFVVGDFAQIEARVLTWLAGAMQLVGAFAAGRDVYSEFASGLFGVPVCKCDDPEIMVKRDFGKMSILASGFGMGASKFYERVYATPDLRPYIDSGQYDEISIGNMVQAYRKTYPQIPDFWRKCEKAFKWVIKYPHQSINLRAKGCPVDIIFSASGHTVYITLPSGRVLNYYHCSIDENDSIREHYGYLWGGAIVENIVQAVARDILMESVLKIHPKFPIILRAHDELVAISPVVIGELALQFCLDKMREVPAWSPGLPIDAEGKLMTEYGK